ncbi:MAG: LysE family transporter [Actinomycetota bacterium]
MEYALLGAALGLIAIVPPGPVNVALIRLAAQRGPRPAIRGAAGIAAGDLTTVSIAVVIVGAGQSLPPTAFAISRLLAAGLLILTGVALLARPSQCDALVDRIERPARTFYLLTSLAPTVLGAWIALLVALPFADDLHALAWFASGVVVASALWHPLLAAGAGATRFRRWATSGGVISRVGGLAMAALGVTALVVQL